MALLDCCRPSTFKTLSRAVAKSAASKLRSVGMLSVHVDWPARAEACERCPMSLVRRGVTYCGTPFTDQPDRDIATHGCGCPTRAKAKSPDEHCPLTANHQPASTTLAACDCKWCRPSPPARLSAA